MEKREIRRKIKTLRSMLSEEEKCRASEEVFERLENNAAFQLAKKILMYHSLPDELPTPAFLRKWKGEKDFYLPRVNGVNLDILPFDESRLEIGSFHIEEPTGDEFMDSSELELIIVPAVAYDRKGNRLGRGKGFYDRLLCETKAVKIGVAYDFQLYDELPTEEHDVPMDYVITQSTVIKITHR